MGLWDAVGDIAGSLVGGLFGGDGDSTAQQQGGGGGGVVVQPPNLMQNTNTPSKDIERPKVKAANETSQQQQYIQPDPLALARAWSQAFKE